MADSGLVVSRACSGYFSAHAIVAVITSPTTITSSITVALVIVIDQALNGTETVRPRLRLDASYKCLFFCR